MDGVSMSVHTVEPMRSVHTVEHLSFTGTKSNAHNVIRI